jgi:hypothetical protein
LQRILTTRAPIHGKSKSRAITQAALCHNTQETRNAFWPGFKASRDAARHDFQLSGKVHGLSLDMAKLLKLYDGRFDFQLSSFPHTFIRMSIPKRLAQWAFVAPFDAVLRVAAASAQIA